MGKKILSILLLVCSLNAIEHISNPAIVKLSQTKSDIRRAYLRQTIYLRGSVYPIRLVLYERYSDYQEELAEYLGITSNLYEIEVQKASNFSAQPKRVTNEAKMVESVSKYVGSLGYLPSTSTIIFNDGGQVVTIKVED